MKSSTRNLVIVAAVIVVLGGAVAVLNLTGGSNSVKTSSSEASSGSGISLLSKKTDDVASMQITNKKGSYTIVSQTAALNSAAASGSASNVTYMVQELEGAPVDSSAISNVAKLGYSLVASKNIGTVTNLSQYGLQDPQATVKIKFKDKTTYNFKVGSASPSDNTSYYMCAENSQNVYIVSIDSAILADKMTFVQKTVLSIAAASSTSSDSATQTNDFTKIVLSGTNFPQSITIDKAASSSSSSSSSTDYSITSPLKLDTDMTQVTKITTALASLSATDVASIHTDAATLKKYGLDKPTAIVSFTVNKKSYKLMAGSKNGSNRYVMLEGVNAVYVVSNDSVSSWADTSLFGLRSKFAFLTAITNVSGMTVTSGSDVNTFTIARTKDAKNSTEDKPVYTYEVTGNGGKKLTYDANFKNYYQTVIAVQLLEDAKQQPAGTPAVTIEYKYYTGGKSTVQFYSSGDRRYTAVVDGKACGLVKSTDVDAIISNTKKMASNALISTD